MTDKIINKLCNDFWDGIDISSVPISEEKRCPVCGGYGCVPSNNPYDPTPRDCPACTREQDE